MNSTDHLSSSAHANSLIDHLAPIRGEQSYQSTLYRCAKTNMVKPRVRKAGRRLIVTSVAMSPFNTRANDYRHDHAARLYCSQIYPYRSSNGSIIVISGTEHGLHVAWHGGKPLYFTSVSEAPVGNDSTTQNDDAHDIAATAESDDEALFDSDDEDLDEDQPYPPLIQTLDIPLSSPVLKIAALRQPDAITTASASLFTYTIVVVLACFDGSLRVLTVPLDPPSAATKRKRKLGVRQCSLHDDSNTGHGIVLPRSLAMAAVRSEKADSQLELIVACSGSTVSGELALYRVACKPDHDGNEVLDTANVIPFASLYVSSTPTSLSFTRSHAASTHDLELAIAQHDGNLQVWQVGSVASSASPARVFTTGFDSSHHRAKALGCVAYRKRILDSAWVFDGNAVFALLEDGEWGVWIINESEVKTSGIKKATGGAGFAISGFIGDAPEANAGHTINSKPHLAPVTPNTRRVRQESLFHGPAVQTGTAPRGGVSVSSTTQSSSTDDSVLIWYGSEVHSIPSLRKLLSRSGKDTGTLYGPGVSRIEGFDTYSETINSAHQLAQRQEPTSAGLGSLDQRDLLITTEHRFILVTSTRPQLAARTAARQNMDLLDSPLHKRDQLLLGQGELDIGGVDRLLDGMVGVEATGRLNPRRVGFAST